MRLAARAVALLAVPAVAVSCSSSSPDRQRSAADKHADTAGIVMTQGFYATPAGDAAYRVAGTGTDDTIDALAATGTNWQGRVVLRVIESDGSSETAPKAFCYEYVFDRARGHRGENPSRTACPTTPALTLTSPAPAPVVDAAVSARVRRAIAALSAAQRADVATVRTTAQRAAGTGFMVGAGATATGVQVVVRAASDTCVTVGVGPAAITAGPLAHGTDCRGG